MSIAGKRGRRGERETAGLARSAGLWTLGGGERDRPRPSLGDPRRRSWGPGAGAGAAQARRLCSREPCGRGFTLRRVEARPPSGPRPWLPEHLTLRDGGAAGAERAQSRGVARGVVGASTAGAVRSPLSLPVSGYCTPEGPPALGGPPAPRAQPLPRAPSGSFLFFSPLQRQTLASCAKLRYALWGTGPLSCLPESLCKQSSRRTGSQLHSLAAWSRLCEAEGVGRGRLAHLNLLPFLAQLRPVEAAEWCSWHLLEPRLRGGGAGRPVSFVGARAWGSV